jgi:hypothetical protein
MKLPQQTCDRFDLWTNIINQTKPKTVAEVGVWKGDFAVAALAKCPCIEKYTMIDPWAQLPDWNKPFNVGNKEFLEVYDEAIRKTAFASDKLQILKGRTKDMISEIEDESLDFVYIDGDHTLRGITLDLILILPKLKTGGLLAGDDFTLSPWQHSADFEPTLVCPFAVYFAEAMNLPIHALQHGQFLITKSSEGFSFSDTTGKYSDLGLNKFPSTTKRFFPKTKARIKKLFN